MIREVKSIKSNEEVKTYIKGVTADLDKALSELRGLKNEPQMPPMPPMPFPMPPQKEEEKTFEQRVLDITNKIIEEADKPENAKNKDKILKKLDKLRPILVSMGAMD